MVILVCFNGLEEAYFRKQIKTPIAFLRQPLEIHLILELLDSISTPKTSQNIDRGQDIEGTLSTFNETPFSELLVRLLEEGCTGILRIKNRGLRKSIYFSSGIPTYSESNILSENLGRFLVQRGVISQGELIKAREVQLNAGIKQGEALVNIGALTHRQLFEELKAQIEEKIINCFGLESTEFHFQHNRDALGHPLGFHLNPFTLLTQGLYRFHRDDIGQTYLGRESMLRLKVARHNAPMWEHSDEALGDHQDEVLKGGQTLSELSKTMNSSPIKTAVLVEAMVCAEMLTVEQISEARRFRKTSSSALHGDSNGENRSTSIFDNMTQDRIDKLMEQYLFFQSANYYEALNLSKEADNETINNAGTYLLNEFTSMNAPDSLPRTAQQQISEISGKIKMAQEVLLDPERRSAYDNALNTTDHLAQTDRLIEAEVQHIMGLGLLNENNHEVSREHFSRAAKLNPDEPTYQLYHGWSNFLTSKAGTRIRKESKRQIASAIDMNPLLDMGYYFMGTILIEEKDHEGAWDQFEMALHFNPDNQEARDALKLLSEQTSKETP
jgi:tetratricopeptide (TPR) repeat protein